MKNKPAPDWQYTDLTYLIELSGGDQNFVVEIIETYLAEMPHERMVLRDAYRLGVPLDFVRSTHKMKNRLNVFANDNIKIFVSNFDKNAKEPLFKKYISPKDLERFILYSERIAVELSAYLKKNEG